MSQVFFGVNDMPTAEYVSNRLGEETIVVSSGGTSTGTSRQSSSNGQGGSSSSSSNQSDNWAQHGRKLLKPEEVLALPDRTAITFTPGVPPIWTTLVRYFEEPNLGQPGMLGTVQGNGECRHRVVVAAGRGSDSRIGVVYTNRSRPSGDQAARGHTSSSFKIPGMKGSALWQSVDFSM